MVCPGIKKGYSREICEVVKSLMNHLHVIAHFRSFCRFMFNFFNNFMVFEDHKQKMALQFMFAITRSNGFYFNTQYYSILYYVLIINS